MNALPNAKNVAAVHGIPQRGAVAEVRLGSEEEFKSDIGRSWRICEKAMGSVMWRDFAAKGASCFP